MGRFDRLVRSADRATDSIRSLNGEMSRLNGEIDRAANTEFTEAPRIVAPASFTSLPPGAPGTPTNPLPSDPFSPRPPLPPNTIFGPDGSPVRRTGSGGGSSTGSRFKLADNPLIPSMTPGAMMLYKSDLEGLVATGICHMMDLPSGAQVISCSWGLYPGLSGGVLSSVSGRSSSRQSSESGGGEGTNAVAPDRTGNQDRSRRFNDNVTNNPTGRQFGSSSAPSTGPSGSSAASSVQLDSRPITDRLDGLRDDIRELSRAIGGDGGAGVRFRGGF